MIDKFDNQAQAVPTGDELSRFVSDCMFHGEVGVLSHILSQEHLGAQHAMQNDKM